MFTWIELVSGWGEDPAMLVTAIVGYTIVTLAAQVYFGVETWTRYGEAFAVYYNLFARMAAFEARDGTVGFRGPLRGLAKLDPVPGTVALVLVMIGTVTFDGLSQGTIWQDLSGELIDALGFVDALTASRIVSTLGMVFGVALVGGFYRLGIEGVKSVGGGQSRTALERGFVHSLVPIAAVYVAAHYFTFLLFEGQAISYLASDPFGQDWDLFGTVNSGIDYGVFPQDERGTCRSRSSSSAMSPRSLWRMTGR